MGLQSGLRGLGGRFSRGWIGGTGFVCLGLRGNATSGHPFVCGVLDVRRDGREFFVGAREGVGFYGYGTWEGGGKW